MSILAIRPPWETSRLIHEIDIPGEKSDSGQLHITLLYLGEETPIQELARAMVAAYEVTKDTSPFWVKLGCVNCFEPADEGNPYPIIAPVLSPKLHELQTALKKSFTKAKVGFDKRFKEYKPHITLSYNDEEIKKTKIDPIEWSVQELVLYGGSDGDNRISTVFPLELRANENISELCCGK